MATQDAATNERLAESGRESLRTLFSAPLSRVAPDVAELAALDWRAEQKEVNLIAAASYCPLATRELELSTLLNRCTTGRWAARTIGGGEHFHEIEQLAVKRARSLFSAEAVNVQPLSATIANVAVLRGLLRPRDRILVFAEEAGGHVSHGGVGSAAAGEYDVHTFGTGAEDDLVDLDQVRRTARAVRPRMIIAGASSYPRALDYRGLARIAHEVGALFFADIAHVSGLVAAGLHENPVPYANITTSSTHKTLCGPRTGGVIFCRDANAAAIHGALYPGLQGPPAAHIIAARAVLFDLASQPQFRTLMQSVLANARALAVGLQACGMQLYAGGTDTHMVVVDLRSRPIDAASKMAAFLEAHGVLANVVRLPSRPGDRGRTGVRLGTTAMTLRGLSTLEAEDVGRLLAQLLGRDLGAAVDDSICLRLRAIAEGCPLPN